MYLLDENGERLSREPWIVKYADSEDVSQVNRSADKIFDLQESTYWSTETGSAYQSNICPVWKAMCPEASKILKYM